MSPSRVRRIVLGVRTFTALAALLLMGAGAASAQRVVSAPEQVITVSKGASALLVNPVAISRLTIGDPNVAQANVVSPTEVVINGVALGTTTLLLWDGAGNPRVYSVEVTADAPALQRALAALMPEETIDVTASGNTVTLTGNVVDPNSVGRAVQVAQATGATVIDNLLAPPAVQVLLKVRFAEISRSFAKEWASQLRSLNPHRLDYNRDTDYEGQTSSDGFIEFLISEVGADFSVALQAAISRGDFRSLAEPNLMTLPGQEAYFLAGGEFPFPTIQAASASNAVTIVFREFGVKLRFTPTIQRNGAIRLKLAPEVSSLDFANGLVVAGFEIPTILTRRAETNVELEEGQFLAIAGLMDNNTVNSVTKIPLLGDIPILGEFFKSRNREQRKTELIVIVTPQLVRATNASPVLPTGEPGRGTWDMDGHLTEPVVPTPNRAPAPGTQPDK